MLQDTVVIYGVGRGLHVPSASPFPLKLETFCRLAQIPYRVDHSAQMSSKGKTPWMMYNGRAVADSQFCIEHLKAERDLDLDLDLSPTLRAQARAFRALIEENLYWTMCYELFILNPKRLDEVLPYRGPKMWLLKFFLSRVLRKELWNQGIGRHSDEEIWDIGRRDLNAISDFLAEKKFFLGDTPTEVDCTVFGMMTQVLFHMPGCRHQTHVRQNLPNIVAYVERMKTRVWPDWEERCKGSNYVDDSNMLFPAQKF
ncbi:failed axon connections homolog [Pomacea canaliculata]|nr:failed axon connections homolog [Pomacea canaliculata]